MPSTFPRLPVDYQEALDVQEVLVRKRREDAITDTLWLLEHTPVITSGTAGVAEHVLSSREELGRKGYTLHAPRRGGDVTCHEPGQLVAYPIVDLSRSDEERDLHRYLRRLEEALILFLGEFGLRGVRIDGRTGVWIADGTPRKIAAMGVRCAGWVTSHGFALNVENDLGGFDLIVPCGYSDAGVTSMIREVDPSRLPSWDELCRRIHAILERTLERKLRLVRGIEAFDCVG